MDESKQEFESVPLSLGITPTDFYVAVALAQLVAVELGDHGMNMITTALCASLGLTTKHVEAIAGELEIKKTPGACMSEAIHHVAYMAGKGLEAQAQAKANRRAAKEN